MKYFVWVKGLRGPAPEKWYGDQTRGDGRYQRGPVGTGDLLSFRELDVNDENLTLTQLAKKYPYETEAVHEHFLVRTTRTKPST